MSKKLLKESLGLPITSVRVGDIIYSAYTYSDAYMPTFYEVISKTPKSVIVRPLERSLNPPRSMYDDGSCEPIPGNYTKSFSTGEPIKPVRIIAKNGVLSTPVNKWYVSGFYKYAGTPVRYHHMTD